MKISLKWLKEYVAVTLSPTELANRLTMAGTEVSRIQSIGDHWQGVVVGQIMAVEPHPNADRLSLVTVDLGTESVTVICGAPNVKLGSKVALAHIGAQLIDGYSGRVSRLKAAKIRGITSQGMVCSEKELGISDNHQGIMILPPEAPLGISLADYLGDTILDLDITPNRPDCLSVIGIAREVAALTGQNLHLPEISYEESLPPIGEQVSVTIAEPERCPRYCASLLSGITVAESPMWLQQRLLACGIRSINNVVDVTNYVMLEYGQPLHAFDYHQISDKQIVVRRARAGEAIATLDGMSRVASNDMLLIADSERAVAIAGVIGGANSEVTDKTTAILLESASFQPASIHHTGSRLNLASEARMRFERGISPELTLEALKRATQLIIELAGGKAARGYIDLYPGRQEPKPIPLSMDKMKRLLAIDFGIDQTVATLRALGFDCRVENSVVWAMAPYWRSDIHYDVDLMEEVARIIGYDKVPTTLLGTPLPPQNPSPIISLKRRVRDILVGYGFQEVITYSLTSLEWLNKLLPGSGAADSQLLRVANPMTAEQEYLRPNLRAGLMTTLASNRRHKDSGIRLFEQGRVYLPRQDDLPEEPEMLCGVLNGSRAELSRWGGDGLFDFYDAKGIIEGMLGRLGAGVSFEEASDASLHPNKQVAIVVGGTRVGIIGELHPEVLQAFEIGDTVALFEINLPRLLSIIPSYRMYQPVARFPTVERDIALIVDDKVTHQKVTDIIQSLPLVIRVTLFDVYSGKQVPAGKKSLAYRLTFQSPSHTLTDKEVDRVQQKILDKLSSELGATLRS
ncbi:MAG: phenylalanine--tRNA ligase subunit beta [Dehalococcoidales bacterium]|nr:phenylalanine--tRNA ligase subunit beta [Dehalococcoidales bacterium]